MGNRHELCERRDLERIHRERRFSPAAELHSLVVSAGLQKITFGGVGITDRDKHDTAACPILDENLPDMSGA